MTTHSNGYALGIDVGGTFTDVVLAGPTGQVAVAKCLSTHDDPTMGILSGVQEALDRAGVSAGEVTRVVHATTLATNAILEHKGVRVAFVTTEGFRHMLTLGRYSRVEEDRFDLHFQTPTPPVAPSDCFEVRERMGTNGDVIVALDETSVREVGAAIAALDVESVAVCLLHSYANPQHEQRVAEILRDVLPAGRTVVTSCDIWPEVREYERATTTLMSAYVGPVMVTYLRRLEEQLASVGITPRVQVMESGGGVMSADLAGRRAVATIESGPAAGVISAQATGAAVGRADVLSFDMGGTTAKACVVKDGQPEITSEFHVGGKGSFGGRRAGTGIPIKTPAIDLAEVGAGGGSIAWVDEGRQLHVGPHSASSDPGPACYGRGGTEPTVTDCNLVLGYLDPTAIAGGSLAMDKEAAHRAVSERLGLPLGVDAAVAAEAVHEIANATMGAAVHVVTVQRGIDPRGFALVAFGGAGPMHAARVAERFEIDMVIVPPSCGVGSAVGLLVTDMSTDRVLSRLLPVDEVAADEIEKLLQELAEAAARDLGVQVGGPGVRVSRTADVRFVGQAHQMQVELADTELGPDDISDASQRFFEQYERAYGIAPRGAIEVVSLRVRVTQLVPKVPVSKKPALDRTMPPSLRSRPAWFGGTYVATAIHSREDVGPDAELPGPAIIHDSESTIVVPPGWTAHVDQEANVVLVRVPKEALDV